MDTRIIDVSNYWAAVVGNTDDFQQIANAQNPELNNLLSCIKDVLNDGFIKNATEYGVERWEKMLDISPALTDSLETRKTRVLTYLSFKTPYSWRVLEQMITSCVGEDNFTMKYINDTSTLIVKVNVNDISQFDLIENLLKEVLPQNIVVNLERMI